MGAQVDPPLFWYLGYNHIKMEYPGTLHVLFCLSLILSMLLTLPPCLLPSSDRIQIQCHLLQEMFPSFWACPPLVPTALSTSCGHIHHGVQQHHWITSLGLFFTVFIPIFMTGTFLVHRDARSEWAPHFSFSLQTFCCIGHFSLCLSGPWTSTDSLRQEWRPAPFRTLRPGL